VAGGWHTVSWPLPSQAGIFPVTIHATDWAGNGASIEALPIVRVVSPPKKHPKPARRDTSGAAVTLPPLVVGAGLQQPGQASLALSQGLGAVRMTLVWPTGAATPDVGALTALNRLPPGTNLVLELYASQMPTDDAGRAALASYAASVAGQVTALRDLVFGPAPGSAAESTAYEPALAAVYDAVKVAVPSVRVAGALDGSRAPKAAFAAISKAALASGRPGPAMDELDFTPAPAPGKNLWTLADLSKLVSAAGALPLLIDGIQFQSEIPAVELGAYSSPTVGTTGLDEPSQGAAYSAALKAVACKPTVVALLLGRIVDAPDPGQQSGLYYADGAPKTSLSALAAAVQTAQTLTRGCTSGSAPATPAASPTPAPAPTPAPTPAPGSGTATVTAADASKLAFPERISSTSPPSVRLGCSTACLYLVAMERAGDGRPVLARRGSMDGAGTRTVTLPRAKIAAGGYRFTVWIVARSNPGPGSVSHSRVVNAR
jgi:hypothetical protein